MADPWAFAQRLIGTWTGPATGRPGNGWQVREYRPVVRGRYILGEDRTWWEPTSDEVEGELHEDLSVLSLDRPTGHLVMHAFHVEGFVHEYRSIEVADDLSRAVFESGQVQNGPAGMRARETLVFDGPDRLESTFEVAMPGEDFAPYTHEVLTRQD